MCAHRSKRACRSFPPTPDHQHPFHSHQALACPAELHTRLSRPTTPGAKRPTRLVPSVELGHSHRKLRGAYPSLLTSQTPNALACPAELHTRLSRPTTPGANVRAPAARNLFVGRNTRMVVPTPSALSTKMVPPCNCTMVFDIASPRPVPPTRRVCSLSTRKKTA